MRCITQRYGSRELHRSVVLLSPLHLSPWALPEGSEALHLIDQGFGPTPVVLRLAPSARAPIFDRLVEAGLYTDGSVDQVHAGATTYFDAPDGELAAVLSSDSLRVNLPGDWLDVLDPHGDDAVPDDFYWMTVDVLPRGGGDQELDGAVRMQCAARGVAWWRAHLPAEAGGLYWSVERPKRYTRVRLRMATWDVRTLVVQLQLTGEDARALMSDPTSVDVVTLLEESLGSRPCE